METVRVDICYRPLRIGWAIRAGDRDAFRQAVRLSYTMWGGQFNPIVLIDREEEAANLIDLFRVDLIRPIGSSKAAAEFLKRFPHLINPFFPDALFISGVADRKHARVLDVHNALAHLQDTPAWKVIKERDVRIYKWEPDDPLADVFLVQFGAYPAADDIGIDYRGLLMQATEAAECVLDPASPLSADLWNHSTIASLTRHSVTRHYSVREGWDSPGFFVGDTENLDDLVSHWNLRAADIPLWFVDPNHLHRYASIIPAWEKRMREMVSHRHEFQRRVAVWSRRENIDEARKQLGDLPLVGCPVSEHTWNGHNVRPPMMHFGQVSTLGVIGRESGRPNVSFALSNKPFCGETWFHTQHLVASVSFIGGLYGDDDHTLDPPFIPELNEFYARTMHFDYSKLRSEPERIGMVIDAADTDTFLYALPVPDLVERVFHMVGRSAKVSSGGLIARQLIAQLGGLQGARAFKIPGVRRLLRKYGPMETFIKKGALQLIAEKDPDNPNAKFEDHHDLFIGPRRIGTKLDAREVFTHLVEKGLFRIGTKLACPNCRMTSWIALDALKQRVVCELCGHEYNATRQLVNGEWHYRRSGVLGAERNAQGAVAVSLTLQQL